MIIEIWENTKPVLSKQNVQNRLQIISQPSQTEKYQCEESTNQRSNTELLERNNWGKDPTNCRS
jgi:hypothetical protein